LPFFFFFFFFPLGYLNLGFCHSVTMAKTQTAKYAILGFCHSEPMAN
jgi:hypothetical protein